jgi:photosystem II stability/assembly factor-like uncharacterized protein
VFPERPTSRAVRSRSRAMAVPAALVALLVLIVVAPIAQERAGEGEAARARGPYAALPYRYIGPPGNRVSAVAGVPGDPNVYYAGGASGGVWKSTDGGIHWRPIFDDQPAQSIGAIAVAPSDPNIVWVGTGETFIRSNVSLGDGIYKSTDAGRTWTRMGLERSGRIGRIVIHPRNPDIVLAAALGHAYGPQQERGVYRTTDGGRTWQRVLFVDERTGASDLAMDPVDPNNVFAGMWQIDIKTWGRVSGGPGSGVFVSRDGGATWTRLEGRGLPDPPLGKIAVAVAPSDPDRVYALIETGERGSLWRSDDGGRNWRVVNHSRLLNERPHYYTRMLVMPDDRDEVYFPSNGMGVTYDGGETTEQLRGWGGDNHDMWVDPTDGNRLMIGNDLGVMITTVRGREWNAMRLPVGQIYHVATDTRVPYYVYGHMQDYSSLRGPSNSLSGAIIHPSLWTTTAGCETGWNIPDPVDPDIVWGGCYAGVVERFDLRTRHARSVSPWPERTMGAPAREIKLRMNWTFPIAISPHDHNTVYVGSQYVHRTTDGGQTWEVISPDLTLNDPAMMGDSGGLTVDNLSVEYAGAVFAIAESPLEKGVIWAGTNDGLVQVTRDGGRTWTDVTANLPGLPPKMTVSSVEPSRHAPGVCYVAIDGHQVGNFDPWLYKTADHGRTWTLIVKGIPKGILSYTHVLREDPKRRGLLYAGTENGVYVSFDDGANWEPLQNNLPHAPVHWLDIQPHFNDLVVGTYGRGIWIMDDVTPLQQMTAEVRRSDVHLFQPRDAYRFRTVERRDLAPSGVLPGRNPEYGASITYWLKDAAAADVQVQIVDGAGKIVRTLRGPARAGLNRVWWDLRYEPTREIALRTTPPGNPHIWSEKRFVGKDSRGIFYYGIDQPKRGPLVAPGRYTVRLRAAGRELTTTVNVLKDPNTAGTLEDIERTTALSLDIYARINEVVDAVNQIEWSRKDLEELGKMLKARGGMADVVKEVEALDAKFRAVEDRLLQKTLHEGDLKSFRGAIKLYLKFLWLQAEVVSGGGDVSGNADYPPTAAQLEVYRKLAGELQQALADLRTVYEQDVPAFDAMLRARGVLRPATVAPGARAGAGAER